MKLCKTPMVTTWDRDVGKPRNLAKSVTVE